MSTAPPRPAASFSDVTALVHAAVERVAATDPNPADPFRGLYVSDDLALALARAGVDGGVDAHVAEVAARLGLDEVDAALLALCVAPELDPRYGRLLAYLQDDVTRKFVTPRIAVRLLARGGWPEHEVMGRLAHDRPLRRLGALRLLDGEDTVPVAERAIRPGEPLVARLLGARLENPPVRATRRVNAPEGHAGREEIVARLRRMLDDDGHAPVIVVGPDGDELLARALGAPVFVADAAQGETALGNATLEAALNGGRLCLTVSSRPPGDEREAVFSTLAARRHGLLVWSRDADAVAGLEGLGGIVVDVPPPAYAERCALWRHHSGAEGVDEVAAKFRHSGAQIRHAGEVARAAAAAAGRSRPDTSDLHLAARQASSRRLEELAVRLPAGGRWDELVLPEQPLELLKSVSAYLRHRELVLSEWGYERAVTGAQGLKVLFFGDSGTGKTMAARVIAGELGLEIYRIDLAAVVSKYIGETEKNLDRIFALASDSNAILFFDEADAVFGKRSEVGDAHDRYANIEVAYLLQKMEAYAGAVVLATNFRRNIDDAFARRLDLAVEFPFPEVEQRRAIWERLLPGSAPIAEDVDIDVLARSFKLSGGSIRNCAVAGAFLAAEDGGRIEMRHLLRAVSFEFVKLGRLTVESDFDRAAG